MLNPQKVLTVSDINQRVRSVVTQNELLKFVYVRGEISNFKVGPNGHFYFSLKDKDSLINAAMFATYNKKITFQPQNGDEVIVCASVDVYPPRGTYQLLVYEMEQVGQGLLLLELEQLKKKLQAEGLFDASRKKEINIYPKAVGIITAKNSAAIKDLVFNINRRYPVADIYVFYSSVQGESAPKELLDAFNKAQSYDLDTIIIGRGGGASEDLSAFNDETLVRAIANSKIPVIAAVGHEIDTTLVDYVADKRASTPTGAAELAVADQIVIEQRIADYVETLKTSLKMNIEDQVENVQYYKERIIELTRRQLEYYGQSVALMKEKLLGCNPQTILDRGYTITIDEHGNTINFINQVVVGQKIKTITKDGEFTSKVDDINKRK